MNDKSASNIVTSGLIAVRCSQRSARRPSRRPCPISRARRPRRSASVSLFPLTGAFGAEAQDQVRCAQLAVEQIQRCRRRRRSHGGTSGAR